MISTNFCLFHDYFPDLRPLSAILTNLREKIRCTKELFTDANKPKNVANYTFVNNRLKVSWT